VRTFDLVSSEDSLFIVMEYVRGADLRTIAWRARLKRRALSPQAVLHVALEILAGLAYAHGRRSDKGAALGIIHRDVSPSNILCSGQGDVKLSDFGIAKATTFSSVFYRVRGKVGYMSPEQAKNQPLDGRSDLFSLAVCLFETLTGERLYSGDLQTPPELIYGQKIPPLSLKRPDLPVELEDVLAKALSRDADERYQDAATFARPCATWPTSTAWPTRRRSWRRS
jgi:serine/threonine-protein kinase